MAIINHFPCRIPTDLSDATAVSSDVKKDKTGYTGEGKISGNIMIYNNSGSVYSPSSSYNTSISLDTGYYDGPKVGYVTSTVEDSIIKYGQSYSITSNGSTLKSGTGTFTNVPSSGQSKASASNIISGYSGFVSGSALSVISPVISRVSVLIPRVNSASYSLSPILISSQVLVALPIQIGSRPLAMGSSVPV